MTVNYNFRSRPDPPYLFKRTEFKLHYCPIYFSVLIFRISKWTKTHSNRRLYGFLSLTPHRLNGIFSAEYSSCASHLGILRPLLIWAFVLSRSGNQRHPCAVPGARIDCTLFGARSEFLRSASRKNLPLCARFEMLAPQQWDFVEFEFAVL